MKKAQREVLWSGSVRSIFLTELLDRTGLPNTFIKERVKRKKISRWEVQSCFAQYV